jgi:SAM-dependent methyltransferase
MAKNVKAYFEHHAHNYSDRHVQFYSKIVDYLRNMIIASKKNEHGKHIGICKNRISLLDIGCGNGSFVKSFLDSEQKKKAQPDNDTDYYFLATDVSFEMIKLAKENLSVLTKYEKNIGLLVSYAFNLPIQQNKKFEIIHVDSVLHHLVDGSKRKSTELGKKLIEILVSILSDSSEGFLIVEEWHFLSYILPSFSSFLIFYGLKLINSLKLDLGFTKEIRRGLEVNFLSPEQLHRILNNVACRRRGSDVHLLDRVKVKFPTSYRLFLLREKSHTTFVLRVEKNI